MAKPQYGSAHKAARKLAIEALIDGTPCRYCLRPMYGWQSLDLDHIVPVVRGNGAGPTVLTHSKCNRSAGGKLRHRRVNRRRIVGTRRAIGGVKSVPRRLPKW